MIFVFQETMKEPHNYAGSGFFFGGGGSGSWLLSQAATASRGQKHAAPYLAAPAPQPYLKVMAENIL